MSQRIYGVVRLSPGDYYSGPSESIDEFYTTRELAEQAIEEYTRRDRESERQMGLTSGSGWSTQYEIEEMELYDSIS